MLDCDVAAGTRLVFDDDRSAEMDARLGGEQMRDDPPGPPGGPGTTMRTVLPAKGLPCAAAGTTPRLVSKNASAATLRNFIVFSVPMRPLVFSLIAMQSSMGRDRNQRQAVAMAVLQPCTGRGFVFDVGYKAWALAQ
jgi:hypothetical protein